MNIRRIYAVAFALVLAVSMISAPTADASCVTEWSACRADATTAYFNDEVGTFRYSLLLSGCDVGYGACSVGL